ncbi:unnamed protein product [Gulo gulo]|uniref:Uncharacterized protein n=1 Tax=Gulo gulo TaxID=48420 RepID=A0A9X9MEX3_GULGU|nr:unnamed protein product [Gulo gulo]
MCGCLGIGSAKLIQQSFLKASFGGARVVLLVRCPTLDFGSGHDLRVVRSSPSSRSVLSMEPAEDSPSPSPSAPLVL